MEKKTLEKVLDEWTKQYVAKSRTALQEYVEEYFTPEERQRHSNNIHNIIVGEGHVAMLKMLLLSNGFDFSVMQSSVDMPEEITEEDVQYLLFYGHTKDNRIIFNESEKSELDYAFKHMMSLLEKHTHFDNRRIEKTIWQRLKLMCNLNKL